MTQKHQSLMVRPAEQHPLVQQHLPARAFDGFGEMAVLFLVELEPVRVRPPHQPLDEHSALGGGAEQCGDRRPVLAQPLVGVAAPVGEEQVVTGPQLVHFADQSVEVGRPVNERLRLVALTPRRQVPIGVAPFT
jgi:hypothetical protein